MDTALPFVSSDDTPQSAEDAVMQIHFSRCVKSFEVEASLLSRGFKTALFIQQFKSGLMGVNEQIALRGD